jgi:hypothetical protein
LIAAGHGSALSSFLCWTFKPYFTQLGGIEITTSEYLRHLALSRIYLDNIPRIRTSVLTQNERALEGLLYGADDFDLPIEDEVTQLAGATISLNFDRSSPPPAPSASPPPTATSPPAGPHPNLAEDPLCLSFPKGICFRLLHFCLSFPKGICFRLLHFCLSFPKGICFRLLHFCLSFPKGICFRLLHFCLSFPKGICFRLLHFCLSFPKGICFRFSE